MSNIAVFILLGIVGAILLIAIISALIPVEVKCKIDNLMSYKILPALKEFFTPHFIKKKRKREKEERQRLYEEKEKQKLIQYRDKLKTTYPINTASHQKLLNFQFSIKGCFYNGVYCSNEKVLEEIEASFKTNNFEPSDDLLKCWIDFNEGRLTEWNSLFNAYFGNMFEALRDVALFENKYSHKLSKSKKCGYKFLENFLESLYESRKNEYIHITNKREADAFMLSFEGTRYPKNTMYSARTMWEDGWLKENNPEAYELKEAHKEKVYKEWEAWREERDAQWKAEEEETKRREQEATRLRQEALERDREENRRLKEEHDVQVRKKTAANDMCSSCKFAGRCTMSSRLTEPYCGGFQPR